MWLNVTFWMLNSGDQYVSFSRPSEKASTESWESFTETKHFVSLKRIQILLGQAVIYFHTFNIRCWFKLLSIWIIVILTEQLFFFIKTKKANTTIRQVPDCHDA